MRKLVELLLFCVVLCPIKGLASSATLAEVANSTDHTCAVPLSIWGEFGVPLTIGKWQLESSDESHQPFVDLVLEDIRSHVPSTPQGFDGHLSQTIGEMVSNANEWGNKQQAGTFVWVTYFVTKDLLAIKIEDQGRGFDPSDVPHASSEEDPIRHMDLRVEMGIREGGFGMVLARGMAHKVQYNKKGNEVTLIWYWNRI